MSAYDHILRYSSKNKFNDYRQSLVSYKRGTLSSGAFPNEMHILYANSNNQQNLLEEQSNIPAKIYLRVGKMQQPGVVFDKNGTKRALSIVSNAGNLKLLEDFANLLKFSNSTERENWDNADRQTRRKCLSRNIDEMIKKTDINYRTHGDRLHYFVVGLVETKDMIGEITKYPLFLFSCSELNKNTLNAEIEQGGFANFWLDKNILENNISSILGGYEIEANEVFASHINTVSTKLNALELAHLDKITVDPEYSALAIVTGFEAEYIDPAWEKILGTRTND